eukprot:1442439-Prymnesium_polylepis.2
MLHRGVNFVPVSRAMITSRRCRTRRIDFRQLRNYFLHPRQRYTLGIQSTVCNIVLTWHVLGPPPGMREQGVKESFCSPCEDPVLVC